MQVFEIDREPPEAAKAVTHRRQGSANRWLLSEATRDHLLSFKGLSSAHRRALKEASAFSISEESWAEARGRLILGTAAKFTDPLPDKVREEAILLLYARPALRLEYVGRGTVMRILAPGEEQSLVSLDVAGGHRRYYFRPVPAGEDNPTMSPAFRELLADVTRWFDDPEAKYVISIGGGGYRMFAVTPVLKVLDTILGDRTRIAEVWGCSGGAVAAHVYSEGFEPWVLDELGYQIYHRRNRTLPDFSVGSVAKLWYSRATGQLHEQRNTIQKEWVRTLDGFQPSDKRPFRRIPFYAVSSNPGDRNLFALTDPEFTSPLCDDFIVPVERSKALAASCAVPLLFPTQRGIKEKDKDLGKDVWIDGGLIDENPLALPFVKWSRERAHDPDNTPKKLKVFLFDLNARASESLIMNKLSNVPVVGRVSFKRVSRLLDMLLDSRLQLTLNIISELPNVEVLRAKLSIGAFAVRDRANILAAIQGGRKTGSWQFSMIGKRL